MNMDDVIKEYEKIKLNEAKRYKKSFPHIISKDSFEKLIMNAEEQSEGLHHTTEGLHHTIQHSSQNVITEQRINTPPQIINPPQQIINTPAQQTSVITPNNVHRKSSTTDLKRLKFMQRQTNVEELADKSDVNKSKQEIKSSTDNFSMTDDMTYKKYRLADGLDSFRNYSMKHHLSFESALQDANARYKRDNYRRQENFKSKSLDILEDPHRVSPGMSSRHFSYDEEQHSRRMSALRISPTSHINALHVSLPQFYDPHSRISPCDSLQNSPRNNLRNSPDIERMRSDQRSIPTNPRNVTQHSPLVHMSRSYESQQTRQYKYGQRKSHSAAPCSPYDRVYREKNLRRIVSEEIHPENLILDRNRKHGSGTLHRASSYDTFAALLINPTNIGTNIGPESTEHAHQQQSKKSTQIIFPEHDNVKDYKNVFTKQIDDEASHAVYMNDVMEKSLLYGPNYINNPLITYNKIEDEKLKRKNENAKSKSLQLTNEVAYNTGPYEYNSEIDDELAVCVSGLLTLPGSNEKRLVSIQIFFVLFQSYSTKANLNFVYLIG